MVQRAASLDPAQNRAALDLVPDLAARADLVVLPEATARDFGDPGSDLAPYAESLDGPFARRLAEVAGGSTVVAGLFETAPDAAPGGEPSSARPFNTLVVAGAAGPAHYRKIHLYDSFGFKESDSLTAGPVEPVTISVAGWAVGLMTCYDLRFPELGRALAAQGAEVLVVPAAWVAGERKIDHWTTLLRARAIENTTYVVGVGQPGPRYTGHSIAVAPDGEVLAESGTDEDVLEVVLDHDRLDRVRRTNPSLANRRM
jgi:predicted amidohydrolase